MDAVTDDGNHGESIKALRRELTQEKTVSFFQTPEELASLVSTADPKGKELPSLNVGIQIRMRSSFCAGTVGRVQSEARLKAIALPITAGFLEIAWQASLGESKS